MGLAYLCRSFHLCLIPMLSSVQLLEIARSYEDSNEWPPPTGSWGTSTVDISQPSRHFKASSWVPLSAISDLCCFLWAESTMHFASAANSETLGTAHTELIYLSLSICIYIRSKRKPYQARGCHMSRKSHYSCLWLPPQLKDWFCSVSM